MEDHIAYIVILGFGAFITLLYKLSYHGRRSGIDQHYGYGQMPSQYYYHRPRRRSGIGLGTALSIVVFFTLLILFGDYPGQDTSPKENYNDMGWTDRINKKQEHNYNYQHEDETQYADNKNRRSEPNQEAGIIPAPGFESEDQESLAQEDQEEEEVIPQKNIRIQFIAGPNEENARKEAKALHLKTGLNTYVMLDLSGDALPYKVMLGDYEDRKIANRVIQKFGLEAFPKDISEKEYEEIAKY